MLPYHFPYIVEIGLLQLETVAGGIDATLAQEKEGYELRMKTKILPKHKERGVAGVVNLTCSSQLASACSKSDNGYSNNIQLLDTVYMK